jgi:cell division protein FtsB
MSTTEWWWLSLGIAAVVVVVVAALLGAIIATARSIDRHAADIWVAGKDIAGNTVSIWMLEKTTRQMESILKSVQSLERSAAALEDMLAPAGRGRRRS